jgi:CRP-like cAMP-binding protein
MENTTDHAFLELCEGAPREHFRPGETLLRQGESGGYCYVLLSGSVAIDIEINDQTPVRVAQRHAGSLIGELSLFETSRCASVVAMTDCSCARIAHPALLHLVTTQPKFALAMLSSSMEKTRETSQTLARSLRSGA